LRARSASCEAPDRARAGDTSDSRKIADKDCSGEPVETGNHASVHLSVDDDSAGPATVGDGAAGRAISTTDHVAETAGGQAYLVGAAGVSRRNDDCRRRAAILECRANAVSDPVASLFLFIDVTNTACGANIVAATTDGVSNHACEGTSEIR
jgi:hypothetical protein